MMIDFKNIEKYHENNRIEAKKAMGGLPLSIWETYSAFANSYGGVILLGVEEDKDKSLHPVNLPDPEEMISEFWSIINDPHMVSVNILSARNINIHETDGKQFISIEVPQAMRSDKPVYIEGNPITGSYRRNGDGDYRCKIEEVRAMLRDASQKTQDMLVLEEMDMNVFDYDSVHRYRIRMNNYHPGHILEESDDTDFLYKLGAAGKGNDGKMHPTAAGLLMFGYEYEIVKEYPGYFLDYQERLDPDTRWTDRIVSTSGDWSGNVYDFFFRVYKKIIRDVKIPFRLEGEGRIDYTPVHNAVREALANCLINADYYGRQGVVVIKGTDYFSFSNPGNFRIDIEKAKSGGISDPRNSALIKMFNMVDIGERSGSGIPNIFNVWKKQGWTAPKIIENTEPDRTTLLLKITESSSEAENSAQKNDIKESLAKSAFRKKAIVVYITEHIEVKVHEITELLDLRPTKAREILSEMIKDGILVSEGTERDTVYKLKE